MTFDMSAGKAAPTTFMQWLIGTALAAFVGAALLMLIYAVINGPGMRAMAESQKAEEIAQENRAFCAQLGMNFGTPAFATCANVIGQIRRLQDERFNRDSGIL
jgi:hypothetical protein